VGFPKLTYPFSPILVVLNTIGPFILSAAAIPLLVFWNVPPTLKAGPTIPLLSNLLTACFGFLAYHTALTLSSAIFAAHLRRHLMVWKVFAPRFMLSALTLLSVDVTILVIAVGWGGIGTLKKLNRSLGTAWS
jgi:phosphatidylinositol glycan class O